MAPDQRDRRLLGDAAQLVRIHAIASRAFGAAELQPVRQDLALAGQDAQQHLLMISPQEDRRHAFRAIGAQPLDHSSRFGAAIDQVAEEDDEGSLRAARRHIALDPGEQRIEQVKATVDVADRIGAIPRLPPRGRSLGGTKTAGNTLPNSHMVPLSVLLTEQALKLPFRPTGTRLVQL